MILNAICKKITDDCKFIISKYVIKADHLVFFKKIFWSIINKQWY